jgi:hypothetical protein
MAGTAGQPRKDTQMSAQLLSDRIETTTAQPVTTPSHGRLRGAWHRIRRTVQDMNYATGRIAELTAPWAASPQRPGQHRVTR